MKETTIARDPGRRHSFGNLMVFKVYSFCRQYRPASYPKWENEKNSHPKQLFLVSLLRVVVAAEKGLQCCILGGLELRATKCPE